jgi:hypothetical protein
MKTYYVLTVKDELIPVKANSPIAAKHYVVTFYHVAVKSVN